jgi:hypothetical protein
VDVRARAPSPSPPPPPKLSRRGNPLPSKLLVMVEHARWPRPGPIASLPASKPSVVWRSRQSGSDSLSVRFQRCHDGRVQAPACR